MKCETRGTDFTCSMEHILAHLERIDLLVRAHVSMARATYAADPALKGLYITEQEVDALLTKPLGAPNWALDAASSDAALHSSTEKLRRRLAEREEEILSEGVTLRLIELARCFDLSTFEIDVVLICLAPELDLRYERLYAFLQDDVTKKHPSVDLTLNILCESLEERLAACRRFMLDAPLLAYRLVDVFEVKGSTNPHSLGRFLRLDPRITDYLFERDGGAASLPEFLAPLELDVGFDELIVQADFKQRLRALSDAIRGEEVFPTLLFAGADAQTMEAAATALCQKIGVGVLRIDGRRLITHNQHELSRQLAIVAREARLQGAGVYWRAADHTLSGDLLHVVTRFIDAANWLPGPLFLETPGPSPLTALSVHTRVIEVVFPLSDYDERVALWHQALKDVSSVDPEVALSLAGTFRLTSGQIEAATTTAKNQAYWRDPQAPRIQVDDLQRACRLHSNQGLAQLAQKIEPHYRWSDIVLPPDQIKQLREIRDAVQHRPLVYKRWGFERKLSLGKCLNILFSGPSGTGKTMAAEVIANNLGVDLYKIDLSSVVSKYIGETEKNLSKIFEEATTSNALLFFDEADALFGKRSEVKDAHDRYANIETAYLLQRMEEYDGVVILATNLRNNMDDAFVRRMAFSLAFPVPSEEERLRIWEGVWPIETPRDDDLDLEFMARQFKLAGGNIKNIGLTAAFLAAVDGQRIRMEHLVHATKREFQKIGKACAKGDFGPYYSLVQGAT